MEQEVGNILRPDNEGSSLQLLPALEEIELNTTTQPGTPTRIDEDQLGPIVGPFKPFMDAWQQVGCPVNLHWNTDWVLCWNNSDQLEYWSRRLDAALRSGL